MITEEVIDLIRSAKAKMPSGWKITTREVDRGGYLVLVIPMDHFESYSLTDRIRIAETTNQLKSDIADTGLPTYVEKS